MTEATDPVAGHATGRLWWRRRSLIAAFMAAVLTLALVVLYREFNEVSVEQVMTDLRAMPPQRIVLALGFTLLGYIALTGYDHLAAIYVGSPQPYRRTALAASLTYAFSQALGFPLLTGAPVRYRLYTSWGVEAPDVARILAFAATMLWLGFLTLAGALFLFDPLGLPAGLDWLSGGIRSIGMVFLLFVGGYLTLSARGGSLRFGSWRLAPPPVKLAIGQAALSIIDWVSSAAALYVLLPVSFSPTFTTFLSAYLLAQILGLLSHVPGGVGVFEAALIVSLGAASDEAELIPSLIAFRALYYLLPLILASVALGALEMRRRADHVGRTMEVVIRGVSTVVPVVTAGAVFLTGALLLATGALPFGRYPLGSGRSEYLPLLEAAHFLSSVGGAGLLILAWGLHRRLDGAFYVTLVVLGGTAILSVLKGAGWPTAVIPLAVSAAMLPARREFFRRSSLTKDPLSAGWVAGVAGVLITTSWLGLVAYRSVDFSNQLWWRFAMDADAPRFVRGSVGAALVLFGFAVARLLRPAEPTEAEGPAPLSPGIAQVIATSPDTHAWLALLGDKSFILSPSGRSFLMYGVAGRAWISMGDPVGDPSEFEELVWRFRDRVRAFGGWAAFYQVTPEHLPLYIDAGLSLVKLGEEAIVPLDSFSLEGSHRSSLRRDLRGVERASARFSVLPVDQVPETLPRLREVSDGWLLEKGTKEKHFSLGSFSEEYIARSPTAVVRVADEIVAFANVWLGAPGSELSIDLMRYDAGLAPEDTMLYLLTQTMLWGREHGYRRFSLGMAPLSGLETGPLASLWSRLGSALYRHGEHFYNFQGLRAFKEKWDPEWESRYLASPGGTALPGVLAGASVLISGRVAGLLS